MGNMSAQGRCRKEDIHSKSSLITKQVKTSLDYQGLYMKKRKRGKKKAEEGRTKEEGEEQEEDKKHCPSGGRGGGRRGEE